MRRAALKSPTIIAVTVQHGLRFDSVVGLAPGGRYERAPLAKRLTGRREPIRPTRRHVPASGQGNVAWVHVVEVRERSSARDRETCLASLSPSGSTWTSRIG